MVGYKDLIEVYQEAYEVYAKFRGLLYEEMQDVNKKIAKLKREENNCKGNQGG